MADTAPEPLTRARAISIIGNGRPACRLRDLLGRVRVQLGEPVHEQALRGPGVQRPSSTSCPPPRDTMLAVTSSTWAGAGSRWASTSTTRSSTAQRER